MSILKAWHELGAENDRTLSDGTIANIHLVRDEDTYTGTVNGQITENDAFETLYYAG